MFFTEVPRRKRQRAGVRKKRRRSGRRKPIVPLPLVVFAVGRGRNPFIAL
jgi:hypothetical protein